MPVALGVNGGVLGSNNLPTATTFRGVFTPNEVARAIALGFWPVNKSQAVTGVAGSGALGTVTVGSNADPYFNLTTLLLSTTATNGQQNNTFQDSSTNNFTITRNGNTTQGTFSPFSQTGWGNYFDGSGDYLDLPSSANLATSSSDFTIECWVYFNATTNAYIFSGSAATIQLSSGSVISYDGSNHTLGAVSVGQWFHLVVCRSGSTIKAFLNGVQGSSWTNSGTQYTHSSGRLGAEYGTGNLGLNGYISNYRFIVGTALYTANFTPPVSPLTAVTNTKLLTCQSNRFIDNSTNNFTITPNGNTSVVPFSPFNPTSAWSASTVGGSGYFDGTGDYLSVPDNAAFAFGTGDFTIEVWVYWNNVSSTQTLFDFRPNATGSSISPYIELTSSGTLIYYVGGATRITTSAVTATSWTHVALSRSGTSTKIFINGTQSGSTYTDSNSYVQSGATIGFNRNNGGVAFQYMNGYISNFRIVKGTAVYTGNFTPPTAPLTAITNTSLLLNFTNAGIYDATAKNVLETVGNAQASTAITPKWGTTSMLFNSDTSWLQQPASVLYGFGTGNFTVECWFYLTASPTTEKGLFHINTAVNSTTAGYAVSTTTTGFNFYAAGTFYASTTTAPVGQWNHLAYVKNSGTVNVYLNGSLIQNGSKADSQNLTNPLCYVGLIYMTTNGNLRYLGYMQDFRVTRFARYTANFTPPTAAFPVQ